MKKTILFLFVVCISSTSCKKTTSCTCKDPSGKIVYNEVNQTSNKREKKQFEEGCLKKESTYYTVGTGTAATTSTSVPCEIG